MKRPTSLVAFMATMAYAVTWMAENFEKKAITFQHNQKQICETFLNKQNGSFMKVVDNATSKRGRLLEILINVQL